MSKQRLIFAGVVGMVLFVAFVVWLELHGRAAHTSEEAKALTPSAGPPKADPAVHPRSEDKILDAVDLYEECDRDLAAAKRKYNLQVVRVRGEVASATLTPISVKVGVLVFFNHQHDPSRFKQNRIVVVFQEQTGGDYRGFDLKLSPDQSHFVLPFGPGSVIVVRGTFFFFDSKPGEKFRIGIDNPLLE